MTNIWDESITSDEEIDAYQDLINTGAAWKLEGYVGRTAMMMIDNGLCTLGEEGHKDYWGNYVPSKHEVKPGSKGSEAFVRDTKFDER